MKKKVTLSVDESIVQFVKEYAARHGISMSRIFEEAVESRRAAEGPTFADKWYGAFSDIEDPDAERMAYLEKRYGGPSR